MCGGCGEGGKKGQRSDCRGGLLHPLTVAKRREGERVGVGVGVRERERGGGGGGDKKRERAGGEREKIDR